MKKILSSILIATVFFSCNTATEKGRFSVTGQLKNIPDQQAYLEELYFGRKDPEIIDTAEVKNGKVVLTGLAKEEGVYLIRFKKAKSFFLFVNDKPSMNFTADGNDLGLTGYDFPTGANGALKKFLTISDSLIKKIEDAAASLNQLKLSNAKPTDSIVVATEAAFNASKEAALKFNLQFADTTKSPAVGLFAASYTPVTFDQIQLPLQKLAARFPNSNTIAAIAASVKQQLADRQLQSQMQQEKQQVSAAVGSLAPDITMNDVNDKPFSLHDLKGKFVLVDFWASWCGPCRNENPNVVAAYNQFKDKNFTVLGVSLDKDKASWVKAIHDDGLTWHQISDLKWWSSAAVPLYGIEGIPYNVLIDPQGKVIGSSLRGQDLINKLREVLK